MRRSVIPSYDLSGFVRPGARVVVEQLSAPLSLPAILISARDCDEFAIGLALIVQALFARDLDCCRCGGTEQQTRQPAPASTSIATACRSRQLPWPVTPIFKSCSLLQCLCRVVDRGARTRSFSKFCVVCP